MIAWSRSSSCPSIAISSAANSIRNSRAGRWSLTRCSRASWQPLLTGETKSPRPPARKPRGPSRPPRSIEAPRAKGSTDVRRTLRAVSRAALGVRTEAAGAHRAAWQPRRAEARYPERAASRQVGSRRGGRSRSGRRRTRADVGRRHERRAAHAFAARLRQAPTLGDRAEGARRRRRRRRIDADFARNARRRAHEVAAPPRALDERRLACGRRARRAATDRWRHAQGLL